MAPETELWHVRNSDVGGKSNGGILSFAVLSRPLAAYS